MSGTVADVQDTTAIASLLAVDYEAYQSPLNSGFRRYVKRWLDVCLSLPVVILVLPPVAVVTWVAHRLQSPGPLFFRQERCGLRGKRFMILKFRTMSVSDDCDSAGDASARIFPIGGLLRKTKLDEIPQFVNTLVGTMSVVGPRPHHFQDCEIFEREVEEYALRRIAKPGITGLAQYKEYRGDFEWNCVSGRVQRDLTYIREWSLLLDLRLIVKTANVILWKCLVGVLNRIRPAVDVRPQRTPALGIFPPPDPPANAVEPNVPEVSEPEEERRAA